MKENKQTQPAVGEFAVLERAAFEAWYETTYGISLEPEFRSNHFIGYVNDKANHRWTAWKARAALTASAPSHGEQVRVVLPKPLKRGDAEAERGEYGGAMARGYSAYERQLIRLNPGIAFAANPSAGSQEQGE